MWFYRKQEDQPSSVPTHKRDIPLTVHIYLKPYLLSLEGLGDLHLLMFLKSLLYSPRENLFDQNYSKKYIVKY